MKIPINHRGMFARGMFVWVLLGASVLPTAAWSQSLNNRDSADPKTQAATARALVSARSQAAKQGRITLNKKAVHMDCQPVQVGVPEDDERKRRLSPRKEQVVVVPGDVINICR